MGGASQRQGTPISRKAFSHRSLRKARKADSGLSYQRRYVYYTTVLQGIKGKERKWPDNFLRTGDKRLLAGEIGVGLNVLPVHYPVDLFANFCYT